MQLENTGNSTYKWIKLTGNLWKWVVKPLIYQEIVKKRKRGIKEKEGKRKKVDEDFLVNLIFLGTIITFLIFFPSI